MASALPDRFSYMPPPELREYCAAAAAHILREREAKYPAAVEARKMTAEASSQGLELMRCVVAQWRWAIDPACPALPKFHSHTGHFGAHPVYLAAELERVAVSARQRAARDPVNSEKEEMANLCEALAWYQQHEGGDARIVIYECRRRMPDALPA